MKLFVIILHFGSIETTQNCINTLNKHETYPKEILVVNNTLDNIRKVLSKNIIVLNNKKNLGFSAGINVGIAYALRRKADAVCLLNNDTIIHKTFLEMLVIQLQNKHVGVVAPAIQFEKYHARLFDLGGKINPFTFRTSHEEVERIVENKTRIVDYVSGCCMLIKKEVFQRIGFFDEHFFLYFEDADFCLRARKSGYNIVVMPQVSIEHELSKSAGKMSKLAIYNLLKSSIRFGKKYAVSLHQKFFNRFFIAFQAMLFLKANPKAVGIIAKALLER